MPQSTSSPKARFILALPLVSACAAHRPPLKTVTRLPDAPRQPDAVALDPTSHPPSPRFESRADLGVVALRSPLGTDAAKRTVQSFFVAVAAEDVAALSRVTSPTALVSATRNGVVERMKNLGFSWRQRFAKLDYSLLDPATLYRETDTETFATEGGRAIPPELRAAAAGEPMEPEDVVLRVHMLTQGASSERLFGDTMTFWLRRDGQRYVIQRIAEDLPP